MLPQALKTRVKLAYFYLAVLTLVSLSGLTTGCADDPSSLGLGFIPPGETTGVRIFDSYADTLMITPKNIRKYVNTSSSGNLIIGISGSYNSKALLKFIEINSNYDSSVVLSAKLKLKYRNYYFPAAQSDSLGQISFDIFNVLDRINYSTVTLDSIGPGAFGTVSKGSYTGTPTADSQEVAISLDTGLVRGWLEYAADTSYPVKNNGIVFIPNSSSAVLKGFYSAKVTQTDLKPSVEVIKRKNNVTDTVTLRGSESLFLATASFTPDPELFFLQAGVSYVETFVFDIRNTSIPLNATINDAQLFLTLDSASSVFTSQTTKTLIANYISDTAGLVTEAFPFTSTLSDGKYMMRVISPFQRWLQGQTNYGILIKPSNQTANLDKFAFYGMTASDPNKRPRVIIKYTPRLTP